MKSAIYIRCSNEAQDRETLKVQEEKCLTDAKNRDKDIYPKIFKDDGWSGAEKNRPAFTEMLGLVKRGEINEIIVYRLDRFSRKLLHAVDIMEDLKKFNCNLVSWTENIDFSTATGKLLFQILVMFAEFERETTLQRTQDAKIRRAKEGKLSWGDPPWGYKNNKEKQETESIMGPDGKTPIVKLLFEAYCREKNQNNIAKTFQIAQSTVSKTLTLKTYYMGKHIAKDSPYVIDYPIVIDKALFDKAKRIREARVHKKKKSAHEFILRNKVYCKECGKMYYSSIVNAKGKEYFFYRHKCDNGKDRNETAGKFEKKVIEKLQETAKHPDRFKNQVYKTVEEMQKRGNEYKRQISEKKKVTQKHENAVERIKEKMKYSDVNWDEWNRDLKDEMVKRNKAENEIMELEIKFNSLLIPSIQKIGEIEKAFKTMDLRKSPHLIDQLLGEKSIEVASDGRFVLYIVYSA